MNDIQREILLQLKEIDRLCRQHDIPYTLIGGSLLGAIRENGFIPWDNDADIAMTRDAYERFKKIFNLESEEFQAIEQFTAGALQICRRNLSENKLIGTVDVFVYDFITQCRLGQKIRVIGIICLQAMLKTPNTIQLTVYNGQTVEKKILYYIVYLFGRLFPVKWKNSLYSWFCQNAFVGDRHLLHLSNDAAAYLHRLIPVEFMQHFTECSFEGEALMISTAYETILEQAYGSDYMIPKKDLPLNRRHDHFRKVLVDSLTQTKER